MNRNGALSFSEPLNESSPVLEGEDNTIAALWTDFVPGYGERVIYQEVFSGPLLYQVAQDINSAGGAYFYPLWLFIVTWEAMPFANSSGVRSDLLISSNVSCLFHL